MFVFTNIQKTPLKTQIPTIFICFLKAPGASKIRFKKEVTLTVRKQPTKIQICFSDQIRHLGESISAQGR